MDSLVGLVVWDLQGFLEMAEVPKLLYIGFCLLFR